MRAQRNVISRNLDRVVIVESAEAELRALETRRLVLQENLWKQEPT